MKIEKVHPVETPYATLTISAGEYDTIRNALNWARTSTELGSGSRVGWCEKFADLYEQLKGGPNENNR